MMIKQTLLCLVCIGALVLQGCAGIGLHDQEQDNLRDEKAMFFFKELDRLTKFHGVRDGSRSPVFGFPYLRTDRFLEALKNKIRGSEQENSWLEWLQQMDLQSRRKEIANLPETAIATLADYAGIAAHPDTVYRQTVLYSHRLLANDRHDPHFVERVRKAVFVPDEYSSFMRWIGLYPLAGIPVTIATSLSNSRYRKWHKARPGELPIQGILKSFVPQKVDLGAEKNDIEKLFNPGNLDCLGLPKLDQDHVQVLAQEFAPVIIQDVSAPYDRFGRVVWQSNRVFIDSSRPAVYFYISHTFLDGKPALQLNFAVWYAERAGEGTPWIEKGPLDGLTYRLTLDGKGKPAMIDIMNNCGCYHFFVPQKERIRKIMIKPGEIEPLIPVWMPVGFPEKRIQLQVSSGWHQTQRIEAENSPLENTGYELIPYESLESLPKENGRHESVFTDKGIMKNSWRIEPYFFFSMGVSNVGYMRQRNHHAVKLVGRDHFTNPYLFDKIFSFNP